MAKVKYGVIVTELKGKIAGQVFQGGNVGYVLRNKGYTPGFSSNARQAANRALIAGTQSWRSLDDSSRAAWAALASSWTFVDKFGQTYNGSGFQVFNSFNANRRSIGLAQVSEPSGIHVPTTFTDFIIDAVAPDGLEINWTTVGAANDYMVVYASPQFSAGQSGNYKKVTKIFGGTVNGISTLDLPDAYNALFGNLIVGMALNVTIIVRDGRYPLNTQKTVNKIIVVA